MLQRERRNLRPSRIESKEATMFGLLKVTRESPAAVQSPRAGVRAGLIGMWKLSAIERLPGAEHPDAGDTGGRAYIIFTPRGRFMSLVEGDQNLSETDASAVSLFRAAFAYTGAYRIEGDAWITRVDRTWNDASVADEHTRFFDLDGDRLTVMPVFRPRGSGGGTIGNSAFVFERMKG
jgi:hypothetical protein